MKMYIGGEWVDKDEKVPVVNPYDGSVVDYDGSVVDYDGSVVDTVPKAGVEDVDSAIASAVRGAAAMAKVPAYQRFVMLRKAADLLEERLEDFARHHHPGGGQDNRRIPDRGVPGRPDHQPVGGGIQAIVWRDHTPRRGAELDRPAGLHHTGALRRRGGHQPLQLPPQPGMPQGGPRTGGGERQ